MEDAVAFVVHMESGHLYIDQQFQVQALETFAKNHKYLQALYDLKGRLLKCDLLI